MKVYTTASVALSLALAASTASAASVSFNKNMVADRARLRTLAFNSFQAVPFAENLLANVETSEFVECSVQNSEEAHAGPATVLIAISKCLNNEMLATVEAWVKTIKDTLEDGTEITFTTTLVDGQCEARTERAKKGLDDVPSMLLSDGTDYRSSTQVLPGEVERIAAFAKFGRVLESAEALDAPAVTDTNIGIISFVNNPLSYEFVQQYERKYQISNSFNFQICNDGESCLGAFKNCVQLAESVDLFMYNPFQITRTWACSKLDGGVPVTYMSGGERKCYCGCPVGTKMQENYHAMSCVPVETHQCQCSWNANPYGFKIPNEVKLDTCLFTEIATKWHVPVPFPTDNYVADYRSNQNEVDADGAPISGPRIDVSIQKMSTVTYDQADILNAFTLGHGGSFPHDSRPTTQVEFLNHFGVGELPASPSDAGEKEIDAYSWIGYQQHRQARIDDLSMTSYGKYELTVEAQDYTNQHATCVGCVAVVDQYRPKATTTCPKTFCDNTTSSCHPNYEKGTAELTLANLETANEKVGAFYDFPEKAKNDACSSERCDDQDYKVQDFFASSASAGTFSAGKQCFQSDAVVDAFKSSMAAHTLSTDDLKKPSPVAAQQCTRCCEYETTLKEWWTDYTCGYEYDIRRCEGDEGQSCGYKQCLVLFGDSIAKVSASIKQTVKDESAKVLEELTGEGFQTYTQVHQALQCSKFLVDGEVEGADKCSFDASVNDLLDLTATNIYGDSEAQYVSWRYRVGADTNWHVVNDYADTHKFKQAQTKITLEAWTACGIVQKFYFYVHLHVHSETRVCDYFNKMFYQTSMTRAEISTNLCAFPGSDFGELTFDYQPNIGLKYARDAVKMKVSDVTCMLTYPDKEPVKILQKTTDFEIIERFAVELQNQYETAPTTSFKISCTFSYTRHDNSIKTHPCTAAFTFEDCNGPVIDPPKGDCQWDQCAGQGTPGPYEACGGKVVRASATAAYITLEDSECCDKCGPLVCEPILGLPVGEQDIKRCVPREGEGVYGETNNYGNYEYDTGYYDSAVMLMAKTAASHPEAAAATALLAASAMVAVVALVVVRRRRHARAEKDAIVEDAYYPLLH